MDDEPGLRTSLARVPYEVARMSAQVEWMRPNAETMLWIEWAWKHGYADGMEDGAPTSTEPCAMCSGTGRVLRSIVSVKQSVCPECLGLGLQPRSPTSTEGGGS